MTGRCEVLCDQCGKDLTDTGNSEDYRIKVSVDGIPTRLGIGFVTDMAVGRPLARTYYFCDLRCLRLNPLATGAPGVTRLRDGSNWTQPPGPAR